MLKFIRLLAIGLIVAAAVGCGKTEDQKAQDDAKDRVADYNATLQDLRSSGAPDATWSDQQINDFEAKVNRLETLKGVLDSYNGSHGIIITGSDPSYLISLYRDAIRSARAEKASRRGNDGKRDRLRALNDEGQRLLERFQEMGTPDSSWSDQKLDRMSQLIGQMERNTEEELALLSDMPNSERERQSLQDAKYTYRMARAQIDGVKANRHRRGA